MIEQIKEESPPSRGILTASGGLGTSVAGSGGPALVVAASQSWRCWLRDFVAGDGGRADVLYGPESLDEITSFLAGGRYRALVFLSHHETLHRDAEWSRALRRSFAGCVVAQPSEVAALAHDKRRMASLASTTSFIEPIPEFTVSEAVKALGDRPTPLVVKRRSGTEGLGFRAVSTTEQLMAALEGRASSYVVQPFIQGLEYSLNLLRVDGYSMCFPVVDKGPNSTEGIHPCRRPRYCPSPTLAQSTVDAMQLAAKLMAKNADMRGICEFEFLVTADATYLVEINPRVAATMRMASLACGSSIFDRLVDATLGEVQPTLCRPSQKFTTEFPVPLELAGVIPTGRLAPDVWVTTRVTIVADGNAELERRTRLIQSRLAAALRSGASSVDRSLFVT